MVEVFITNIPDEDQAMDIMAILEKSFSGLNINFDMECKVINYPCGHSILRVEGNNIPIGPLMAAVNSHGFGCDILEDKPCRK